MQIIVNDIHIRYEDSEADSAHPIAVGIMLENISVQSTDENWVRRREYKLQDGSGLVTRLISGNYVSAFNFILPLTSKHVFISTKIV